MILVTSLLDGGLKWVNFDIITVKKQVHLLCFGCVGVRSLVVERRTAEQAAGVRFPTCVPLARIQNRCGCNICGPKDCAYFVSGRRTVFMYDVPNKRQIDCVSQRQQTSSFHGVNSGIILEITPVVKSQINRGPKKKNRPSNPRTKFTS